MVKCLQNPTADVGEQEKDNSTGAEILQLAAGLQGWGQTRELMPIKGGSLLQSSCRLWPCGHAGHVEPDTLILREMRNVDFTVNCFDFDLSKNGYSFASIFSHNGAKPSASRL